MVGVHAFGSMPMVGPQDTIIDPVPNKDTPFYNPGGEFNQFRSALARYRLMVEHLAFGTAPYMLP